MQQYPSEPQERSARGQFGSYIQEQPGPASGRPRPTLHREYCPTCGQEVGYAQHHAGHPSSMVHMTPLGIALIAVLPVAVGMLAGFLLATARSR